MHPACMLRSDAVKTIDKATVGALPGGQLNTESFRFSLSGGSGGESSWSDVEMRVSSAHCTPYSEVQQDRRASGGPLSAVSTLQFYNVSLQVDSEAYRLPEECLSRRTTQEPHSFGVSDINQAPLSGTVVRLLMSLAQEEVFSGDQVSIHRPQIVDSEGYLL